MIIIWSGKGLLVPIIIVAILVGTEFFVELITQNNQLYQTEPIYSRSALMIAGLLLFAIAKRITSKNNTFFYLPLEHWGLIIMFLAFLDYFKERVT